MAGLPLAFFVGMICFFQIVEADINCPYNYAQLPNGSCVTCETWQYPGPGGHCIAYPSHADKLAGDRAMPIDNGNTAWMLAATALVFMMTPGLGFFYAGLAGENTAINTMMMSLVSIAITTVSWVLFGYSFAYSSTGNGRFGSGDWAALQGIGKLPSPVYGTNIPHSLFAAFQCMFAQITPAIISGAVVGRMTFVSYCIFIFLWSTIVYNCLAQWMWSLTIQDNGNTSNLGWLRDLGAIDFAGGVVIHTSSGFAALAAALVLGERRNKDQDAHNIPLVMQGASLLYFGWFGFNAGSAGSAGGIASIAFLNTHISTASCILTWMFLETAHKKTQTPLGAAIAIVVGLVVITPGCGFVTPMASIAFGVIGAFACYGFLELKGRFLNVDDTLDAFACHGVGGVVGSLLTGCFATDSINGVNGAFYGRPSLLGYQLCACVVSASFSFFSTAAILLALKHTIGIRVAEDVEEKGIDMAHVDQDQYTRWQRNTVRQFTQNLPRSGSSVMKGRHLMTPAAEKKLSVTSPQVQPIRVQSETVAVFDVGDGGDGISSVREI